jgi:hypothetical protein
MDEGTERFVQLFRHRLLANYLLELRGFSAMSDFQDVVVAAFVRSLFVDEQPGNFTHFLIDTALQLPNGVQVLGEVGIFTLFFINIPCLGF